MTSDVDPPNWNRYSNYCRGEQRWLGNHSCYETSDKLSPMAIFTMIDRPVDHQAVYELSSHSLAYELGRFTGANLVKVVDASNYVGFTPGHVYLLPSSMLDIHRLRSCIRYIVRVIKSRHGNGHIPSWSLPTTVYTAGRTCMSIYIHVTE